MDPPISAKPIGTLSINKINTINSGIKFIFFPAYFFEKNACFIRFIFSNKRSAV